MCGIIAVKGKQAKELVIRGLKKLEYRGYDSCGIGCKVDGNLEVYKAIGYIENLEKTDVQYIETNLAIGHTRWATHGGVEIRNSHPHSSTSGMFTLVHNGIIENYKEIKNTILCDGKFVSETDSEVIVQLVEYYYSGDIWEAFKKAVGDLIGSYAIVMISNIDDTIYFARHSSPLILSKSKGIVSLASDIVGFNNKEKIYYIPDNTIGFIDNKIHLFDKNFNCVNIDWVDMSEHSHEIDKAGYPHYMLKEIMEIPSSLKRTYEIFKSSSFRILNKISNVIIIGCGTSYHSGLMACKYIEEIANIRARCEIASEFIYNNYLIEPNTLAIFISQSGETADTLTALRRMKNFGVFTLAITNVLGSTITNLADETLYIGVGAEVCVASTKAYTSQVLIGLLLSFALKVISNRDSGDGSCQLTWQEIKDYVFIKESAFEKLFDVDILNIFNQVQTVADKLSGINKLHLIGKDYDYITSMEGALKIKEVTYIFTDAYPCGELKHGTLSLIENGSFVISIATSDGVLFDKTQNAMHEISARGGKCIVVSQLDNKKFKEDTIINLPKLDGYLMPIISIVPIDILAYSMSINRGINPDKPRNLAKSVTVE